MFDSTSNTVDHKNRCYILIGLHATGKSFWCDRVLSRWKGIKPSIVGMDDLVHDECSLSGETFDQVAARLCPINNKRELDKKVHAAIGVRRDIIVDCLNLTEQCRSQFLSVLPDDYQRIGVIFDAPNLLIFERLKTRAEESGRTIAKKTIFDQQRLYQTPNRFEFHRVTHIDHTCQFG